ncbi:MAG: hypothetical protein OHK93_007016 [Ramalina farinacea]|uniref:Major facilitator superfamily (MFS) profile domain-containing protein n=1 Tax=Ramalina farinacea TaxID=258253 RepID=A0AA43QLW6_9LECA|nr:hypothetical protein [Ramalina farinacea]
MATLQRRMDDEASIGESELEVRREDQDKINKFSRLHNREQALEESLKVKAKDKEDLEEVSNELELADEDENIPYKIGDTFMSLPLPEVQELLSDSTKKIEKEVIEVEGDLSTIREEMDELKVQLYASGAINFLGPFFHVTNEQQLVLPISLFLVGYVLGPLFFGPLSESYGRRIIMLSTFVVFTIFTMACALAPNWPTFLVFRLICGINASSPIAVVGGLYADIFGNPVTRGRAMACFMVRLRKETGDPNIFAAIELEKKGAKQMITVTLMRPLNMIAFEAIVLFSCLYTSLAYAIFYLFFEAYPIIFQGTYHMNAGVSGLAFLPIMVGLMFALGIFLYYDCVLQKARKANKPWASIEEYRRLPLACLGGPLYVISLFWLGWSARASVHWIVPMLAGVPFGAGFMLIFMALLNYITDAYEIYAASGMAATSIARSIFGAVLPLAAAPMYRSLGVSWASSLLGFLSLAMTVIPFAFIKYGDRIRANSRFCNELKALKEKNARQKERDEKEKARIESVPRDPEEAMQPI